MFSKEAVPCYILTRNVWELQFLHFLSTLSIVSVLIIAILLWICRSIFIVVLICISYWRMMFSIFPCAHAHFYDIFSKIPNYIFYLLKNLQCLSDYFWVVRVFYILWINIIYQIYYLQIYMYNLVTLLKNLFGIIW